VSDDHASLMDDVYRYQRYIYDVTRKYYLFGRDRLIDEMRPTDGARIVEVGCGTARNLIRIARRYPNTQLFGLDASEAMLDTASRAIRRAGLGDRIALAHGYAEVLAPAMYGLAAPFDEAIFPYSLSMIPDWKQAIRAAGSAISPSGRIHIVDFGDLAGFASPLRAGLLAWLRLFHVAPRTELLHTIEATADAQALRTLTGRYAFLYRGAPPVLPI
jgi:S-adenosylmethionine-diacylgycerolhomoserine-N-methlytransferase